MAKLKQTKTGMKSIDISEINLLDNVRKEYKNIPELAASIRIKGQMQPCGIDKDNNLIWGHRRFKAVELLKKEGESIQLKIVYAQGDRKSMQMIENLHRDDLSAEDKENGIEDMISTGMNQKEVADALCLSEQKISDMRVAHRTRKKAVEVGADTKDMSTSSVNAMRSVKKKDLPEVIEKAKKKGGTVKAAKEAVKDLKKPEDKPIESDWNHHANPAEDLKKGIELASRPSKPDVIIVSEFNRVAIECYRSCRNKISGYCTKEKITIDSFGMCSNFKEV